MSKYPLSMNIPEDCQKCGFLIEENEMVQCVLDDFGCNERVRKWLQEHDKQIRAEIIEEFRKFSYCKVCEEKGWDIYCEYCRVCQSQEYIAEQLKEQK